MPTLKQIRALNRRIYALWPPKWRVGWDGRLCWEYGAIYYGGKDAAFSMGFEPGPVWILDGMTPIGYDRAKEYTRDEERRRRTEPRR